MPLCHAVHHGQVVAALQARLQPGVCDLRPLHLSFVLASLERLAVRMEGSFVDQVRSGRGGAGWGGAGGCQRQAWCVLRERRGRGRGECVCVCVGVKRVEERDTSDRIQAPLLCETVQQWILCVFECGSCGSCMQSSFGSCGSCV